ncbi:WSC domain-containing protein [Paramyrothecium foliicola]|nr:WSC domain-containing protein [Paramyrothecium foliicola]
MRSSLVAGLLAWSPVVSAGKYVWPSEYDEIEDILALQAGYVGRNFSSGVTPCSQGGNVKGRHNAAEWIRTAFHDMITHDSEEGTGGLDASIFFETDRQENNSRAFNNTINFFNYLYSVNASASDLLAMSVIVSHSACGGTTKIPFRYGRVDAQAAGQFGVPETHTPLQTMLNRFATAGLNHQDMITLTACGHTLGGVHSVDHPDIVPGDTNPFNDTVVHFDSSPAAFDNKVAVEFVDGTTNNPLVIGTNNTQNSDLRIFTSDKNETITNLANDNTGFEASCSRIFSRMIDTVPGDVKLSEPIEPVDIKPYITDLSLNAENKLLFAGRIRVKTTGGTRDASDLQVQLHHAVRNGRWSCVRINATYAGESTGLYGETFAFYEYNIALNATKGISKFNIITTSRSTGAKITYDNEGNSYPVDDTLLYQRSESCVARTAVGGLRRMTGVVAIRKDRAAKPLRMDLIRSERRRGVVFNSLRVEQIPFEATDEERGDWAIFKVPVGLATNAWLTSFNVVQEGEDGAKLNFIRTEACPRT